MSGVTISALIKKMNLELLTKEINTDKIKLYHPDVNRPALQLAGYYEHFDRERVQLIGVVEYTYMQRMTEEQRLENYEKLLSSEIPCIIFSTNNRPGETFLKIASKYKVPVMLSEKKTSPLMAEIIRWLNVELAPTISIHGVLVDVYGEGVLITGESGIGKSEAALELIKRGHRLVSDDVVEIRKVSDETLVGSAPDITRHFIKDHGFRDICFMTGDMRSEDALVRHKGFLTVMEEEGIPVTDHMVFEGDYWRSKGKEAVDWFLEGRDTYPQAIICSNDYMALSICDELKKRGIRIPEDICVSGYDDILEVRRYHPSITSIKAPFAAMGEKAVEIIDRVRKGVEQKRVEWLKPEIQLRRSCGCGKQEIVDDWSSLLHKVFVQEDDTKQLVLLTTEYQDAFEEDEYLRVAERYLQNVRCSKAYLCMCSEEEKSSEVKERDEFYSDEMILKRIFLRIRREKNMM